MNLDKTTIDFLNKVINKSKDKTELEKNLNTYKDYLVLTEIYSSEVLEFIDKMISQATDVINIKTTFGSFDVNGVINNKEVIKSKDNLADIKKKDIEALKEEKKTQAKVKQKHYSHYMSDDNYSTSSCGSRNNSYSGCTYSTPTYGSSCGGGSPYRSSC